MSGTGRHPDRRGNNRDRAGRKRWLLRIFGDGTVCPCWWCPALLDYDTVEADRIKPGGSYSRDNIVPACRHCNASRGNTPFEEYCPTSDRNP